MCAALARIWLGSWVAWKPYPPIFLTLTSSHCGPRNSERRAGPGRHAGGTAETHRAQSPTCVERRGATRHTRAFENRVARTATREGRTDFRPLSEAPQGHASGPSQTTDCREGAGTHKGHSACDLRRNDVEDCGRLWKTRLECIRCQSIGRGTRADMATVLCRSTWGYGQLSRASGGRTVAPFDRAVAVRHTVAVR